MTLFHILDGNTALVLSVLTGYAIPFLSALATRGPSFLTGFFTMGISALSGFLAEWVANPNHFDWKAGAATALGAWAMAFFVAHKSQIAGTPLQDTLHAKGLHLGNAPANMHTDVATPPKAA